MTQDNGNEQVVAPASYVTDIRPLFRTQDVNCMDGQGVEIGNTKWMCEAAGDATYPDHANARLVFSRVEDGTMPPDGAWDQAKLDLYQRWMTEGFAP